MKPWLNSYPEGIPENIAIDDYTSVAEVFDQSVEKYSELPAFSNFGKTLTYGETKNYTDQFGAYLKNDPGLKKGERVAVMMPNLLTTPTPF